MCRSRRSLSAAVSAFGYDSAKHDSREQNCDGRHADGSGEPAYRLWLGSAGPLPAVVVVAFVACPLQ
jgi:hypothetical protein